MKRKDFRRELEERERLAEFEKSGGKRSADSLISNGSTSKASISGTTSSSSSTTIKKLRNEPDLSQLDADEKIGYDDDDDEVNRRKSLLPYSLLLLLLLLCHGEH